MIWKRKPPEVSSHGEENDLERSLRLAAGDPGHRPDFYACLLDSTVYVLGHAGDGGSGSRTVEAGDTVSIQSWARPDGSPIVPFFSSMALLRRAIDAESEYLRLPARSLLEITKGQPLVLNPGAPYGKEFTPNEIAALLCDGTAPMPETRVIAKQTEVALGQPADYPNKMVDALSSFFAQRASVRAAYLALMHDRARDEKPNLVVGIAVDDDALPVVREAGTVISATTPQGQPVDMVIVEPGGGEMSEYFLTEVEPFYERS